MPFFGIGVFEMIVWIVLICVIGDIISKRQKYKAQRMHEGGDLDEVLSGIRRMEKRINNLETIILEDEKQRKFDHSLSGD